MLSVGPGSLLAQSACAWTTLANPFAGLPAVYAMVVFDDGSGPALWIGGDFSNGTGVLRWNGSSWSSPPGSPTGVRSLAVFDDGAGPALYVGGFFTTIGATTVNHIARWNGLAWTPLGAGITNIVSINALFAFSDATGSALYAGLEGVGQAGGTSLSNVARWNGTSWSAMGLGFDNHVNAFTSYDDGSGAALYAGGKFTASGIPTHRVAKWNGVSWSPLGQGLTGGSTDPGVWTLEVYDDGSGPALYAGGQFTFAGGVPTNNVARWNGTTWSAMNSSPGTYVLELEVFDDGTGPGLYGGGTFTTIGGVPANNIARWNGTTWSALGTGVSGRVNWHSLAVLPAASGAKLCVGGDFSAAGGVAVNQVAAWTCGGLPAGVTVFGNSSPGCSGPLAIAVNSMPQVGNGGFAMGRSNAPPNAPGLTAIASARLQTPTAVLAVDVWIDPATLLVPWTTNSNAVGTANVPLAIPSTPALAGLRFFTQFFWPVLSTPLPCPAFGLAASNALDVTIQP